MLIPNKDGILKCADDCGFSTSDIFEFLQHSNIDFEWGVRLNKRFSFDLFTFLSLINDLANEGNLDGVWDAVQSATLMMVNVSDGDLEEFVEEIVVAGEMDDMISDIEKLLKKDGNEKD